MRKFMWIAGMFQFVVALVLAAPAVAQQSPYTITVPFPFHVNAQVLPAGEYRVSIVSPGAVRLYGIDHIADTAFAAYTRSRSSQESRIGSLVFHRYGRQYFLAQVWFSDADAGYELYTSSDEREYARRNPSLETVLRAAK